jgi:hypothetical protein
MGASLVDLRTILKLRAGGLLHDRFSVAEIGAQQFANEVLRDPSIMAAYAEAFGVSERRFGTAGAKPSTPGVEHQQADAPYTKAFWDWLGCPYMAIDYDGSAHCVPLDLNFDDVPAEHRERYDLVTNFGTTEHIANQLQAMKVIHDLTRRNGLMLHTVPTQGNADHAMFNYNPKFFFTLSRSCRYHIVDMALHVDGRDVPLGDNLVEFMSRCDQARQAALREFRMADAFLVVAMQKREDIPFVPPIEVHAGITDPALRRRYWTVFGEQRE